MEPGDQQKHYFTRAEVAELFEVAPNTVSRWVRTGKLPCVRTPGGRRRYPIGPILRLVRQFREGVDTTASMAGFSSFPGDSGGGRFFR
jgi:excisionase family DNA binding protein